MADRKTELDKPIGGLFLMIVFTTIWTILAEFFFDNLDFRIVGIGFGVFILYLVYHYLIFKKKKETLPEISIISNSNKEKWYWIILALEGVAIFIVKNVLVNINKDYLFISSLALIVGLHFIPLAKVFDRKFDYYIGIWTITISIAGILLITIQKSDYRLINAFVCTGCAISTLSYGLKMIKDGNRIMSK